MKVVTKSNFMQCLRCDSDVFEEKYAEFAFKDNVILRNVLSARSVKTI